MNNLAMTLIAIAGQVSVAAVLGMVCYPLVARRGPGAAAWTLAVALGMIIVLTGLAFCPLRSWWTLKSAQAVPSAQEQTVAPTALSEPLDSTLEEDLPSVTKGEATGLAFSPVLLHRFWRDLERQGEADPASNSTWPTAVVLVFVIGSLLGIARLILGLCAVHGYRRRSKCIEEPALHALVHSLRIELGCLRQVELRESPDLATAATIGWMRPVLFLPADWRSWSAGELRVVLAHELAHVRRWDYASGLLACLSVALHFYHPLVHWLAARLRLQQELAADALGARFAGGSDLYLQVLAQMALRQSRRPVGWPARAFLPAPGTLLRRVQMLKAMDGFPERTWSRNTGLLFTGVLLCAAVGVSAVGSPAQRVGEGVPNKKEQASGQDDPNPILKNDRSSSATRVNSGAPDFQLLNSQEYSIPIIKNDQTHSIAFVDSGAVDAPAPALDLSYLPPDAMGAWGIHPAALFRRPEMKEYTAKFNKLVALASKSFLKLPDDMILPVEDFEQITGTVLLRTDKTKKEGQTAMLTSVSMMRSVKDFDWAKQFKAIFPKAEEVNYEGKVYFKVPRGDMAQLLGGVFGAEFFYYVPDSRTIVINSEENIRRFIHDGKPAQLKFPWNEDWKRVERSLAAYALSNRDLTWLKDRKPTEDDVAGVTSLLENSESLVVGVYYQNSLNLQAVASTANEEKAQKTAEAFHGLLEYALKTLKKDAEKEPPQGQEKAIYDLEIEILDKSTVRREGKVVRWHVETSKGSLSELMPHFLPEDLVK
jgi:beta-lactamase regulating signal transducer with metallopeptidase domain